jgi:hypothetical protein
MKRSKPEITWGVNYLENGQPRPPRTKKENQYLDELVGEYNKDQDDAWEFVQFVIRESERFDQNKQNVTGRLVERLAKELRKAARELLKRIVERRSYIQQLSIVAYKLGEFVTVTEARSSTKETLLQEQEELESRCRELMEKIKTDRKVLPELQKVNRRLYNIAERIERDWN